MNFLVIEYHQEKKTMAFRMLFICALISMVYLISIQSSPLTDEYLFGNDFSSSATQTNPSSVLIHPYKFISLICQQQEQYPAKLTRKLCSNFLQFDKVQDQQQRGKRVGWTISV